MRPTARRAVKLYRRRFAIMPVRPPLPEAAPGPNNTGRLRPLMTAMLHTAHKHAFCITCGFCLLGQTHRCPECGRPFDPDDLFSYAPPPDRRRDWRVYGMAAVVVVGAAAIAAAIVAVMPT